MHILSEMNGGGDSMKSTSQLVELHVDESGRMWIPEELQEKLVPGTVLVVERQKHGAVWLSVKLNASENQPVQHLEKIPVVEEAQRPQLVKKGRVTVLRGEVPEGFDWDAFIQQGREERLQDLLNWIEK
jgi:hypothetical protein